ncbi:MAG: glycoside hydrolase family 88 protein [Butyrivibrio sp.]|uniref:glycoside hydrolase family 88 protein n=1 Tax=Butyrivibrio sp. TaxID=28121 RepID=UPI0025CC2CE0|nr:glycoside hydrolase family 88 protein [Butyrivibrio sp.]MCR5770391.1 glycoside hydrolase family 88 protein [Butyrivibrio sp.]
MNSYSRWASEELDKVKKKIEWVSENNKYKLPYTTDENGIYDNKADKNKEFRIDDGLNWWTNGFWAGILWLIYNDTKDKKYLDYARIQEEMLDPCFDIYYGLHHDVGFMFMPSAAADYRLTGNIESRKRALHAASLLAGRFNEAGGYIRAWNDLEGCDTRGWAIIDSIFNISLLFFASRETNDPRFAHIATAHASTIASAFIRQDGSSCHIVEFDPFSGERLRSHAGQGYKHGSAWTRGQGWALYGFTNAYVNSKIEKYLDTAEKVADYCLLKIADDAVIPADFDQPKEPFYEDSCGACVIAGGLIELSACTKNRDKSIAYLDTGYRIIRKIADSRADYSSACEAIVKNCSAAYYCQKHNESMVYADYFYIEALYKLVNNDFKTWQ